MTNDTIFLMLSCAESPICYGVRIYEFVEKYGTMVWDYRGDRGDRRYGLEFPPVIKSLENGKFILFPQVNFKWKTSNENWSFYALEVWDKNKTLTRSPLELPISFPRKIQRLWIVQL